MRPRTIRRTLLNALGVISAVIWFFPVYWMIRNAFGDDAGSGTPALLPRSFTLENFQTVFADPQFWSAFTGSATVTGLTIVISLAAAFLAAIAVTRFRFRGRSTAILSVLIIQMIPAEALFLSQFRMLDSWALLNSFLGLSLMYVGLALPITLWVLRGFVAGVPRDVEEAAMIDGCSQIGAFTRITLPMLMPGLVVSGIFCFLAAWNEYILALVIMSRDSTATLPLWLRTFSGLNQATDWGGTMAGSLVVAVPVIVIFLLVQNRMATGMSAGAVKG